MRQAWVFLRILVHLGFNGRNNGPATLRSVFEMLLERIIASFPSIKSLSAKKADTVIGVFGIRFEVESGFCQLETIC